MGILGWVIAYFTLLAVFLAANTLINQHQLPPAPVAPVLTLKHPVTDDPWTGCPECGQARYHYFIPREPITEGGYVLRGVDRECAMVDCGEVWAFSLTKSPDRAAVVRDAMKVERLKMNHLSKMGLTNGPSYQQHLDRYHYLGALLKELRCAP